VLNSKNHRTKIPSPALFALWFFGSLVLGAFLHMPATAADKEKVLRHVVMYKFKDDLTPAQLKEVIDTFAALPKKIDTIIGFEHGTNVSKEGKSEGFTHMFVVTFKNEADVAAYLVHPAHEAYVKIARDRREKVVVFDYWAER